MKTKLIDPALEIYVAIAQVVMFNLKHFTEDGTGFSVSAFHHPQGEGSDLDEHEIDVFQIGSNSKALLFTTYVKNEEESKKVIDFLKNIFPADLVEFHETYRG